MLNQLLWKYLIRRQARILGFLDPLEIVTRLAGFAQPSEVLAPTELLRAATVMHARGLLNAQAIQHNLDWVWPYWVNRQFDPENPSFIPRAFSLTHINMTHRNWTAAGLPDCAETPIVDPAGLLTPFWDSWSIDAWLLTSDRAELIPARFHAVEQKTRLEGNLIVLTKVSTPDLNLAMEAELLYDDDIPTVRLSIWAEATRDAELAVSVRPYNPEGISLIKSIANCKDRAGFVVNDRDHVYFDKTPARIALSCYKEGDVYRQLKEGSGAWKDEIVCNVGMASAAAVFPLERGKLELKVTVPLRKSPRPGKARLTWDEALKSVPRVSVPDPKWQTLSDAALQTLFIHTADDVFAGPFTYKRFWFRDAAFITYALLCVGAFDRAARIIDGFPKRQKISGYFESQEGEWDSNGQVLWLIDQYCRMTGNPPKPEWMKMIISGAHWIVRKRTPSKSEALHAGLMPPGFSAEHFGPNDFYYWDDFWSAAGLRAAARLVEGYGNTKGAAEYRKEADALMDAVDQSLKKVRPKIKRPAMPSSPYRRLDSAAVGALAAGYPLQLFPPNDPRLTDTADFLAHCCLVQGGFFHEMSHSGINPYLSLHIAQVFLAAGDLRYLDIMNAIARLASPTGHWPEAIHPATKGGCMGDGQHVWAAAEWLMMVRNCFVREENEVLILGAGVPVDWLRQARVLAYGPVATVFGKLTIMIHSDGKKVDVECVGKFHSAPKAVEVRLPGQTPIAAKPGEQCVSVLLS